jgi:hypothetical protein
MTFSSRNNGRGFALVLQTLTQDFGRKYRRISRLTARIGRYTYKLVINPALHARILKWQEQLALLKRKEMRLLAEIQRIEKKHAQLRVEQKLMGEKPRPGKLSFDNPDLVIRARKDRLLWLILLLAFMLKKPKPTRSVTPLING